MSIFKDTVLLIKSATGSFGNVVLRRFLYSDIKEVRIFSRDEKKEDDMRHALQNPKVKFYIGDVRDKRSVDTAMLLYENEEYATPVPTYLDENVSTKVVKIIQSYTGVVNKMVWRKENA